MDSDVVSVGVVELPQNILDEAGEALHSLIPKKSKARYEKVYDAFKQWQCVNNVQIVNESVLLAYFHELSKKHSPSSLWVYYSMLRSTISVNENVDIKVFQKLYAFVKRQNVGNVVKKAKVLTDDELKKFLIDAIDEQYLLCKVVTIFGLFGACRCDEIYNLSVNDVKIEGSILIVTINQSKTYKPRFFTVVSDGAVNQVEIVKKYMRLRPKHAKHDHFFVFFNGGKCSTQRVGIHKIAAVPKLIATFLGLPNAEQYTGHCLQRSSATILANTGANVTDLKRLGGWKSSTVAEAYIEESVQNKIKVARRMVGSDESSTSTSLTLQDDVTCRKTTEIVPSTSQHVKSSEIFLPEVTFSGCTINVYYGKKE